MPNKSLLKRVVGKVKRVNCEIRRRYVIRSIASLAIGSGGLERFGNEYGGYKLAVEQLDKTRKLTVLSFGIGEDLSFSEAVIDRLQAEVYAFDPTPRTAVYVANHRLSGCENFHFYPVGLSNETKKEVFYFPKVKEYVSCSTHKQDSLSDEYCEVQMNSFSKIVNDLNISDIDVLKMDIEGSEFDVMEQIMTSGVHIGQIGIEVHDYMFTDGSGMEKLKWLMNLFKANEYSLVYISKSNHEMTFVKTKR